MPITIPTFSINNLFLSAANFVPFRDIILGHGGAMRDIVLNIIMMMPFGFLLSVIRKQGLIKTIFYTFLFSLAIESTQLISPWIGGITFRSFDVTDLITNTTGGAVGYIIFLVLRPVVDKVMGR
jgi:glycopeptide antibiotics resistance protein